MFLKFLFYFNFNKQTQAYSYAIKLESLVSNVNQCFKTCTLKYISAKAIDTCTLKIYFNPI